MSDLIWLSDAQMRRIERHFPRSHGVPRVDDRRIVSGPTDSTHPCMKDGAQVIPNFILKRRFPPIS
jgi:hypothetical protein